MRVTYDFRDQPFSEDYGELTREEMRKQLLVFTPELVDAPAPLYHGFSKPPEPAKPYPGSYAYPVMYGLCALLAITGVGGLWWMVPGWIIPVTCLFTILGVLLWSLMRMAKGN